MEIDTAETTEQRIARAGRIAQNLCTLLEETAAAADAEAAAIAAQDSPRLALRAMTTRMIARKVREALTAAQSAGAALPVFFTEQR